MVKQSEELLKTICKDISKGLSTECISKVEQNKKILPETVYHAIYYFVDHIHCFYIDRDDRYKTLLTLMNGKEDDTLHLLAAICAKISDQAIHDNPLSYTDALNFLDQALALNPNHLKSISLYGDILWK